ncbi:MAG TPA: CAP domain-containing protein, partial [Patescibacteria group bacterium]|nr:CAP domain-containing protein [Patescibacteria group bacterium]
YLSALLTVQLVYNFVTTGEIKILSFATSISQTEVINLTNEKRLAAGVGAVRQNSFLDQAAAKKAADMFQHDYWAHVSPSGTTPWYFFDLVGYKYIYAGENLARDFDSSSGVVTGWMNSPSHRDNMLSGNYTDIGVAVVNGILGGQETTLVVQLFGKPQFVPVASTQPSGVRGSSPQLTPQPSPGEPIDHAVVPTPSAVADATPVVANPYIASPQTEEDTRFQPSVLSLEHLNGGQKMMLAILIPILSFFLFDAVMILRRRQIVIRGHSLIHGLVIGIVIVVMMTGSMGVLR